MSYRVWLMPGEWKHADTTLAAHKDIASLALYLYNRVPLVIYFREPSLALELSRLLFEQGAGPAVLRYVPNAADDLGYFLSKSINLPTVTCGMFCPPLSEIEKWLKEIETDGAV